MNSGPSVKRLLRSSGSSCESKTGSQAIQESSSRSEIGHREAQAFPWDHYRSQFEGSGSSIGSRAGHAEISGSSTYLEARPSVCSKTFSGSAPGSEGGSGLQVARHIMK
jgi:hypothetical protein